MMPGPTKEAQHNLVDELLSLHPPQSAHIGRLLDEIREEFLDLGHSLVACTPVSAEQTIAIRKLHDACQAAIAAVVLHQDAIEGVVSHG